MPKAKAGKKTPRPASGPVTLLVGTRKGAFFIRSDRARRSWALAGPHFLGNIVNHLVLDPRDGKTLLCAVRAGHLGPTVFRSTDSGRSLDTVAVLTPQPVLEAFSLAPLRLMPSADTPGGPRPGPSGHRR